MRLNELSDSPRAFSSKKHEAKILIFRCRKSAGLIRRSFAIPIGADAAVTPTN
jgi:hypothetical protein